MTKGACRMTQLTPGEESPTCEIYVRLDRKCRIEDPQERRPRQPFKKDSFEYVGLIKHGVSALLIDLVADEMGVPKDKLLVILGLPRATIQRKAKTNQSLSVEASSRVLGISRLIGQTQAMVETFGDPDGFDAATWVAQWLDQPLPAIGGKRPAELMDTAEGQAFVSNMLSRTQSGAYT
jgi:putative toxin-antitoxin system antitoxin component (TIGR02293 family)